MNEKQTSVTIDGAVYIVNCYRPPTCDEVKAKIARLIKNDVKKQSG